MGRSDRRLEVSLGLVFGVPAQRLLAHYRLSEGGYLGVGMVFMGLAPLGASRLATAAAVSRGSTAASTVGHGTGD